LVGAALSLGVFYGCKKEESLRDSSLFTTSTDIESRKPTISIEDAKAWFETTRKNTNSVVQDKSNLFVPNATLNWQKAANNFSQNGIEFVTAPVGNNLIQVNGDVNLLVYKDSVGNLAGCFLFYIADSEYDKATNGVYQPSTFTGRIVYTDINGYGLVSYKIENGKAVKQLKATAENSNSLGVRDCMSVVVPCGIALTGCWIATFCDCSPCTVLGGGRSANGGGFNPYSFPTSDGPTATCGSCGNDPNSVGGGSTWGGSQPTSAFTNVTQVINALKQDQFPAEEVDDLSFSTAKLLYASWSKYKSANFTSTEFRSIRANESLFGEVNQAAAEEYGMDATFREDALLYQKLLNESSEFAEVSNTLNALSNSGIGGDPLKNVLLDLITEGANEWLGNLLGLDDIEELKSLLNDKTKDKLGKISFKVTRVIARYIAKKFPLFSAANSLWKIKEIYSKINRVYKRLSGLWQNRYFVGIEQKLQKLYDSLKKNKLLSKLDVDDNGGLLTNSNKDQSVWNDLTSAFGKTPISDGRNGLKFQVDDFIFNWYPVSDGYKRPTIEVIYKHPSTGSESTIIKIRF
jgi:hypothetical protein